MSQHSGSRYGEHGLAVATEAFSEVMEGAKVIKVDPSSCIPLISIRKVVKSGVKRIKYSLADCDGSNVATGAITGGLLPTVVELAGSFEPYVVDYFAGPQEMEMQNPSLETQLKRNWYGVVDGTHRLLALWELQSQNPEKWAGFQWSVLLLKGVTNLPVLRAFARAQNLKQIDDKLIETTLYDTLKGLHEESLLFQNDTGGRKPAAKELAESYSLARERTTSAMRTMASLSLRLTSRVLDTMGDIMNFECPALASIYYAARGRTQYSSDDIHIQADCRVYRNFLTMTTLRQANVFMGSKDSMKEELQSLTLHRAKECSRQNGFKPISHRVLNEQYLKARAARIEAERFETLLGSHTWPKGMEKLKHNLLLTTELDAEVEDNEGNGAHILPAILEQFRRTCPQKAPMMEAKYMMTHCSPLEKSGTQGTQSRSSKDGTQSKQGMEDTDSSKATKRALEEGWRKTTAYEGDGGSGSEGKTVRMGHDNVDSDLLLRLGITCFEMTWQTYNKTHFSNTDSMFDLIITEPPRGTAACKPKYRKDIDETITETEMRGFAAFARRVLAPGGYIILFTPALYFTEWVKILRWNEFTCMDYPFVVLRDARSIQRDNRLLFPQQVCDFAVMASRPGQSVTGFKPNFMADYNLIHCNYKRKFSAIDSVPIVANKLRYEQSRAVICTSEKNSDLLAEMLVTFSPERARVLDPYAGSMSLGLACMNTKRLCTLIEKDSECFTRAYARLLRHGKLFLRTKETYHDICFNGSSNNSRGAEASLQNPGRPCSSNSYNETNAPHSDACGLHDVPKTMSFNSENLSGWLKRGSNDTSPPQISPPFPSENVIQTHLPPRSEDEGDIEDRRVTLLVAGKSVGTALIQRDLDKSGRPYKTSLHGSELQQYQRKDERLVVVWNAEVAPSYSHYSYPYDYGGIEGPISTLEEMNTGFHAWDLNAMVI